MIHNEFIWPEVPGLPREYVIALGRCNKPGAFHNMLQSGLHPDGPCVFCNRTRLKGEIIHSNEHAFMFIPPGDFNRHAGVLERKFVIALVRHGGVPVFTRDELDGINECREILHKDYGCFRPGAGGILYTRYGSTVYNAGTVIDHLHENVDEPNGLGEVRPAVYKDRAGWEKDNDRLKSYLASYRDGMTQEEFIQAWDIANPPKK